MLFWNCSHFFSKKKSISLCLRLPQKFLKYFEVIDKEKSKWILGIQTISQVWNELLSWWSLGLTRHSRKADNHAPQHPSPASGPRRLREWWRIRGSTMPVSAHEKRKTLLLRPNQFCDCIPPARGPPRFILQCSPPTREEIAKDSRFLFNVTFILLRDWFPL